mgnify:CR=1 FL=1
MTYILLSTLHIMRNLKNVLTHSTKQSLTNLATHMSEMPFWDAQPKGYKSK